MSQPAHLIPWFSPVTRRHPHSFTLLHFPQFLALFPKVIKSPALFGLVWPLSQLNRISFELLEVTQMWKMVYGNNDDEEGGAS